MKKESIKLMQDNLDFLVQKHSELLRSGKYNEALNVMKNVDSMVRQLRELGISLDDNELDWYSVLKFFIETKQSQLIYLDYSSKENIAKHRGTGKTTAIVKLATEFNLPIYEPNNRQQLVYLDKLNQLGKTTNLEFVNYIDNGLSEIILVDETAKINLDNLRGMNKIFIGFRVK